MHRLSWTKQAKKDADTPHPPSDAKSSPLSPLLLPLLARFFMVLASERSESKRFFMSLESW